MSKEPESRMPVVAALAIVSAAIVITGALIILYQATVGAML